MWRNLASHLRGFFAGATLIAAGVGIGLLAGAAYAQESGKGPGWTAGPAGLAALPRQERE